MTTEGTMPIFNPDEASKGAFQGIKKVQGVLSSILRVPSRFESSFDGGVPSDQVEIKLESVTILEMDEGEPEPELKDDEFTFWLSYAKPDKPKPNKNTWYVKHFLTSGKELGVFTFDEEGQVNIDWKGKVVTLERQERMLFKRRNQDTQELEEITQTSFVFIGEEAADVEPIEDYARKKVAGKNQQAALRTILMDNRTKHNKELVAAARDGSIGDKLGLVADDKGVYQLKES